MKIKRKKQIPKLLSILLSFTISFTNILPVYASEVFISESSLEEMDTVETDEDVIADDDILEVQNNDLEVQEIGDSRYEMIEINYNQSSSYYVTIPKMITLGADKRSSYSIKVVGDIIANKQICVVPVDRIKETEVFDFYMKDQTAGSTKEDVIAEISQSKFYWDHEEAAAGYEENNNYIIADGLSAGKWQGSFQMEISMRTNPSHIHNYIGEITKEPTCTESGEKTYTCDCGDSYKEAIDPTGHHYENGECTDCGEKDPDHVHSYTETVMKEPTCTEAGEKTYTCECGDSYTEVIPATGHHYENGECTDCGEKDPDFHKHSYTETVTKEPTCIEAGEKTYTCECGDSYTEVIPATGHHYENGECTDCGEKDPDFHKHSYTETVTKEPTCAEAGEKTYACDCGDSYTEVMPATEHNYVSLNLRWKTEPVGEYPFTQNGNMWTSSNKNIHNSTSRSVWNITLNEETKYTITYKVSSESQYDKFTLKLDDITIANAVSGKYGPSNRTITLSKGMHTLTAEYKKDSSGSQNDDCAYVILEETIFDFHRCSICKNEEAHNYEESIIKPTCTGKGVKTYACICGDSYTELIQETGHNYSEQDGICSNCGLKNIGSSTELNRWNYTLDDENDIITLNYYDCTTASLKKVYYDVVVTPYYNVGGKVYKTRLANFEEDKTAYMFTYVHSDSGIAIENGVRSVVFCNGIDTSNLSDIRSMFGNCTNIEKIDFGHSFKKANNISNISGLFSNCRKLSDIKNFDTINTSNVTDMSNLFFKCESLSFINVSNFVTNNVTDMSHMLAGMNTNLIDLGILDCIDTSKATNMEFMLSFVELDDIDISSWDTSKVTDMNGIFSGSTAQRIFLNGIDTSCVKDLSSMFWNCSQLTEISGIDNIDTISCKDFRDMFYGCKSLESLDLSKWYTIPTYVSGMFEGCSKLKVLKFGPKFYTTNVRGGSVNNNCAFERMFYGCSSLSELDLRSFTVTLSSTYTTGMFTGCSSLKTIYATTGKFSVNLESNIEIIFN